MYRTRPRRAIIIGLWATLCSLSCGGVAPVSAPMGHALLDATNFYSSFESNDPLPSWINAPETDGKGQNKVSGIRPYSLEILAGNVMDQVYTVGANSDNPPEEGVGSIVDNTSSTKWLAFTATGWVQVQLKKPIAVKRYALTSANDAPERDPVDFEVLGSNDGTHWSLLDRQHDQTFDARHQMNSYAIANNQQFTIYRLNITRNRGSSAVQIADWQLSNGASRATSSGMQSIVGNGPTGYPNAKSGAGFTGQHALKFAGSVDGGSEAYAFNKIFDVNIPVTATSVLSYLIFPEGEVSTSAAVDLAFDDGTYLSDLNAEDQHFIAVNPKLQGRSRTLYANEWNQKIAQIGTVAAGKTIKRILIGFDTDVAKDTSFSGWIDDIEISGQGASRNTGLSKAPSQSQIQSQSQTPLPFSTLDHLSDYVLTTRGTNSSGSFSRGNNFPATALPNGFNFWTPVTNAQSDSWLYTYHRANDSMNLPTLQALSLSHEPSPWMGDRQSLQIMPSAAKGKPSTDKQVRGLAFQHNNEIAKADYYSVTFENGIRAEITPSDHAAIFRFTFPGTDANLIFDSVKTLGGLRLDPAHQSLTGWSDSASGLSVGATRIFVYASFDKPIAASEMNSAVTGYFRFKITPRDQTVTMRIATSLISIDQAKKNLAMEIGPDVSFDQVHDQAQRIWDEKLGVVKVEGANFDQLTTLYSNLYRLFLYPNSAFENTGTQREPRFQHASPVMNAIAENTETKTGAAIVDGKIYVNNGFWDTYRAVWPALTLLTPTKAGELVDGFINQYKEGGWVARWSSPGYADLMTGTSSDVAFADAFVKGVANFDAEAAYNAALKNATVLPPVGGVGRKGMESSQFLGYTSTATGAGLSWSMAANLNDFGIANFAEALGKKAGPRQQQYSEEAEYFRARSLQYANLFDPAVGFFQGRSDTGAFRLAVGDYDPRVWGFDYTETNGWNTAFDAPHDGEGLAGLYGGRRGLADKLDAFFRTPETATLPGSYGGIIHEMIEARDVRMGQLGMSNQPSFHIPYMYNFAGQPWKTQEKVRDALARLWIGSAIGQGYIGDEDNGAMSAWQILSALGFYPLEVGSPIYAIGSPLFTKATVQLEKGKSLIINAPENSSKNIYVQGLSINGQAYSKNWLSHEQLAEGGTLDFTMGASPSPWGSGQDDVPPSITKPGETPNPLRNAASNASGDISEKPLVDSNSTTGITFNVSNPAVTFHFRNASAPVEFYTLTTGPNGNDPGGWVLKGSNDGSNWVTLDERNGQKFPWRTQTRPFKVANPGSYGYYRLEFKSSPGMMLAEWELLTRAR